MDTRWSLNVASGSATGLRKEITIKILMIRGVFGTYGFFAFLEDQNVIGIRKLKIGQLEKRINCVCNGNVFLFLPDGSKTS